ncbi:hypothetical protein RhiirA1_403664 [Rhizophagus irregularis]|uniref:Uncharacterized protein n=1 Tax=Rhizophagus irregularis TaxID=588596 RepID=A0A2N0QTH6_9GLOM|nr:hypothetical protein RhiirA1_403664 [Rhizophagus irregularis]
MRKLRRHNDRAVEKKEKAGDALGRSFEGEDICGLKKRKGRFRAVIKNEKMTTQTSTQAQVIPKFGEQKKAFSIDKLKRLVNAAKSMSDFDQAKRYLCSYFIPCSNPHGVFMWRSEIKKFEHILDKNISKLICPITKVFYT